MEDGGGVELSSSSLRCWALAAVVRHSTKQKHMVAIVEVLARTPI